MSNMPEDLADAMKQGAPTGPESKVTRPTPHGGDLIFHAPILVVTPVSFKGGIAGGPPGSDAGSGGNIHFEPGEGGACVFVIPDTDPHIQGGLYVEDGFLKVSKG
jgi:hypothetical protein